MGERSLAQLAYEAYWRSMGHNETPWSEKEERVQAAWAAAAAACAPGEGHDLATSQERERQAIEAAKEMEAERDRLTEQLREASLTAALEAQTSADLRAVNAALRAQLAEATRTGVEWVTDGNTLRLVVRRVTEASVGAVVPSDRGADWTVRVSGGPSAQGFEPGDASTEQAKRIVEMVAGVRP